MADCLDLIIARWQTKQETGPIDPGALSELSDLLYDVLETIGREAFDRTQGALRSATSQTQRRQYERVLMGLEQLEKTIHAAHEQIFSAGGFPEVGETGEAGNLSEEASNAPAWERDEQRR